MIDCSASRWDEDLLDGDPAAFFVFDLRAEPESTAVVLRGLRQDFLSLVVIDADMITYCMHLKNCSFNRRLSRLSSKNVFIVCLT